jgi:hypothetical protein
MKMLRFCAVKFTVNGQETTWLVNGIRDAFKSRDQESDRCDRRDRRQFVSKGASVTIGKAAKPSDC